MTDEHLIEKYKEASRAYALGEPIMTDFEFDNLQNLLREKGHDIVNWVSEDFLEEQGGAQDIAVNYETFSIKEVSTWTEVEDFFHQYPNSTFCASLKFNGICTKTKMHRTNKVAESRNRNSKTPIDFTEAINLITHTTYFSSPVSITMESFVGMEHLPYLRAKYGEKKYKMPRSAALSMLRTPNAHDKEDVKLMDYRAFATDKHFDLYSDSLEWLSSKGFKTPKYEVFSIDLDLSIKEQLMPILESVDTGEPSDGVVICVNETGTIPSVSGKYLSTQIAFKLEKWAGRDYESEVIGLVNTKAKGNKGCVLLIEPFVTADNATITRVNAYNIGIVLGLGIEVGSTIRFKRVSDTICNLIYN